MNSGIFWFLKNDVYRTKVKKKSLNKMELFWLSDIGLEYVLLDRHFVALSDTSLVQLRSLWIMWDVSFNNISRQDDVLRQNF